MATIFRQPLIVVTWRVRQDNTFQQQDNTLNNVLVGRDTFFQGQGQSQVYDYPNPRGYRYPLDVRSYTQGINFPLFLTSLPSRPLEWINPRGYPFPLENRTYVDPQEFWLFGTDKFFTGAGQGPNYDYPNPLVKRLLPIDAFIPAGLSSGPLGLVVLNPFQNYDQPNPLRAAFPVSLRSNIFFYVYDDSTAFFSLDWPNPVIKRPNLELRTLLTNNLYSNTLYQTPDAPKYETDWPNPLAYLRGITLRTGELSLLQSTLNPGIQNPGFPAIVDNPKGYAFSTQLRTYTATILNSTLAPAPPVPHASFTFGSTFIMPNPTLRVNYNQRFETPTTTVGVPLVPPAAPAYFAGTQGTLTGIGH